VSSASTVLRGAGYSAQSGSGSRWHVVAACGEAFMKDELRHVHIIIYCIWSTRPAFLRTGERLQVRDYASILLFSVNGK